MPKYSDDLMFSSQKQKKNGIGCLLPALLLLVAICAVVLLLNVSSNGKVELKTEKVSVMSLDKAYEGFTILHLSDLHGGDTARDYDVWRNLLYGTTFDAVVLSGDMVGSSGNDEPLLTLIHNLKTLRPEAPIYFVAGDDDPDPVNTSARSASDILADWVIRAQEAGAVYLDIPMAQETGDGKIWFVPESLYDTDIDGMLTSLQRRKTEMETQGKQYEAQGNASYRLLCYRLDVMERTQTAISEMKEEDLQIAVIHAPLTESDISIGLNYANRNEVFSFRSIDLILSGHYCNGQWLLPGIGAIYVPDVGWFPKSSVISGMQRVDSINQYISPGLGASEYYPMKGRFCNPPAATLLKFTSSLR